MASGPSQAERPSSRGLVRALRHLSRTSSDRRHGYHRTFGEPFFQIVIFRFAFRESESPAIVMDDESDIVRVVERRRCAVKRGVIEVPLRRRVGGIGASISFSLLRCVMGKDKVARFGLLVAGEAALHKRRVARFAVCEVTEPPTAGCGVLF